jgi:soluble lytic murein transglycosylase-like protein
VEKASSGRTRPEIRSRIFAAVGAALLFLQIGVGKAVGDVYYTRDAEGVFHFSNTPRPGAARFIATPPPPLERLESGESENSDQDPYGRIIGRLAGRFGLEPALVKAVIRAESGFDRRAVSPAGARGLMQLMPATARIHGCRDVYDPDQNITAGVKHLRLLLDRYGDNLPRALAAYNAGSEAVDRHRGIPPIVETIGYVSRVLRYRRQYLEAAGAASRF